MARAPTRWSRALPRRTLVIADDAHHLGEELTWGVAFAKAFEACPRWLLLSGTPFRSDATPIPGVSYDADGMAEPDVSYSYAQAVADKVCRPVCFVAYDGSLSWRSGDDVIDLPVMRECGFAIAVANARDQVKARAHFITPHAGGCGAARDAIDFILEAKGILNDCIEKMVDESNPIPKSMDIGNSGDAA